MLCSVEAHVLKEVSQSALVVIFQYRTHFLCDVEFSLLFRQCVVTDVISQSIIQLTDSYLRVGR